MALSIAMRLADRVYTGELPNYTQAVAGCIRCNFDIGVILIPLHAILKTRNLKSSLMGV